MESRSDLAFYWVGSVCNMSSLKMKILGMWWWPLFFNRKDQTKKGEFLFTEEVMMRPYQIEVSIKCTGVLLEDKIVYDEFI